MLMSLCKPAFHKFALVCFLGFRSASFSTLHSRCQKCGPVLIFRQLKKHNFISKSKEILWVNSMAWSIFEKYIKNISDSSKRSQTFFSISSGWLSHLLIFALVFYNFARTNIHILINFGQLELNFYWRNRSYFQLSRMLRPGISGNLDEFFSTLLSFSSFVD